MKWPLKVMQPSCDGRNFLPGNDRPFGGTPECGGLSRDNLSYSCEPVIPDSALTSDLIDYVAVSARAKTTVCWSSDCRTEQN
ncbi:MAG: hypothetical protein A2W28_11535 [Gammaproteobacteria bacterium RBG_16_51_14]|nr:MAG: hypothetical protein A2W28_11535 [Gammaproteobacteria bacterium RBG_16_51_14]